MEKWVSRVGLWVYDLAPPPSEGPKLQGIPNPSTCGLEDQQALLQEALHIEVRLPAAAEGLEASKDHGVWGKGPQSLRVPWYLLRRGVDP